MASRPNNPDTLRSLKQEIASHTLGQLYIFHGEETYLRDYYLAKIKETLLSGEWDDFNYHTLTAREYSLRQLREYINAVPMMSERTMVVVWDTDLFRGDREETISILSDLPDYLCLIFVYDVIAYKPDGRAKLAKLLAQKAKLVEFCRQSQENLVAWIIRRFRAQEHMIDQEDARYLLFLCGDLMTGLISEIGKIGAYARERRITRQDIDAVAVPQLDAVVFQMTDAISAWDFNRAFSVLSDLLHMGETPIMLLAVMGKQIRQLYTARLALENRQSVKWLMELWGMRSAYPAEKLMTAAGKFSLPWCRRAVSQCEALDLALKSTGQDGANLLIDFLLKLSDRGAA